MHDDASNELGAIEGEDRMSVQVMSIRTVLYFHAKQRELICHQVRYGSLEM